jgi:DNA-binding transcriptional LysR family regulator
VNLQQLRAICEVVERGFNISEAARTLSISQPALSKQIRSFEIEMKTTVFIRANGRLTSLTPTGHRIHLAARSALGSLAEIRAVCRQEDDVPPERFAIAASRSLAQDFLPGVIGQFVERYRTIEFSIVHAHLGQMIQLLLERELSLALTIESGVDSSSVLSLPFHEIPRVVVVPPGHPLLGVPELTLQAMINYPLVVYDESYSIRREVLQAFRRENLLPTIAVSASGADAIKAYVSKGLGIAVLAASAYDPRRDADLRAIAAGHLFPRAVARILLSKRHYLRQFELDFIQLCAPGWTRARILQLQEGEEAAQ